MIEVILICTLSLVIAQDPSLTISPNPVDEGDLVEITCSYRIEGEDFMVYIYYENTVVCSYTDKYADFNIRSAFVDRIDHNPPRYNYKTEFTITLKSISKDDKGTYKCSAHRSTVIDATIELEVYVPPRAMDVFMSSQPPYTESKEKLISATSKSYDPLHGVTCTFSIYPNITSALIWPYTIARGNDRKTPSITSVVLKDGLYDVTMFAPFPLTREDNGKKSLSCEVTWRRTNRKYSAQLESSLNVTFSATNGISMSMNRNVLVESNSTSSPICTWGSANPPKPIKWIFKDVTVSADSIGDKTALLSTSHYEAGEFHGQTTVSRLTVTRELNQRKVSCCVRDESPLLCEHSEVLDVIFPPTTATLTSEGVPIVGETMRLTCMVGNSHPESSITWDFPSHWQTDITHVTELTIKPGEFGGTTSTSIVTFVVRQEDLLEQFTCKVIWNGVEVQNLRTTQSIGMTTTPQTTSTMSKDDINSQVIHSSSTPGYTESDGTGSIIGGSLGGLLVVFLVIIIIIVILWKRQVPFPGSKGNEKKASPDHVYENDGAKHTQTTARQRGELQRTHGEGEYEDVPDNVQRTQGTSDYEEVNGTNQQRVTRVEYSDRTQGGPDQVILNTGEYIATVPNNEDRNYNSQSAYSTLGPHTSHESPAPPNVYDRLSPYENL